MFYIIYYAKFGKSGFETYGLSVVGNVSIKKSVTVHMSTFIQSRTECTSNPSMHACSQSTTLWTYL